MLTGKAVEQPHWAIRTGMILVFSLLYLISVAGQSDEVYKIRWMGQYPEIKAGNSATFGERLSRIVFGEKQPEIVKPFNIVAANHERYWILDQGSGVVFEVTDGHGELLKSMKRDRNEYPSLVGICREPGGDLLFTDSRLNRVIRISDDQLHIFGDTVTLVQPTGIACNHITGEIWVVETGAHQIALFNSDGHLVRKVGGRGTGPGLFNYPTFIWIDPSGRIYIVDSMNYRIQVLDSTGKFLNTFGKMGDATGDMARPKGVATDSRGHIYVADALFNAVQIFDGNGRYLYSFGSQGHGEGQFWMPAGIYIDKEDHIYVADCYNARIQVFQLEKTN